MNESALRIGVLLPGVLGTYGDGGNAQVLAHRAHARDLSVQVVNITLEDALPQDLDIYLLGGGEDIAQSIAVQYLRQQGFASLARRKAVLAICAALQVLGHWFIDARGLQTPGLEVLDVVTLAQGQRSIGELLTAPAANLGLNTIPALGENKGNSAGNKVFMTGAESLLTGFENHGGATFLGPGSTPVGQVLAGQGNVADFFRARPDFAQLTEALPTGFDTQQSGWEGARTGQVLGTYLHGPILARNPHLADLLISWAINVPLTQLTPVAVPGVAELREQRIGAAGLNAS